MRGFDKELKAFLKTQNERKQTKINEFMCETKFERAPTTTCVKPSQDVKWKGKGPNKKEWFRGETYNVAIRGKRGRRA